MGRAGAKSSAQEARRCLVNGSGLSRTGMIRYTLDPDGKVVADLLEKLGGRGVWVSADLETTKTAIGKKLFARGFKSSAVATHSLIAEVEAGLVSRLISLISLARKSGDAVAGADRVKEWLMAGKARLLFQALDGSPREKRNIGDQSELEMRFEILSRQELGMAFGRENVVHAAITGQGLANRVYADANRLAGFRKSGEMDILKAE